MVQYLAHPYYQLRRAAVFSPLAQGLMTAKYLAGDVPTDSRAATSAFLDATALTPDYLDRIRGINQLALDRGDTIPMLALAWVLRHPAVTTAIIGASRVSQIDEAISASQLRLEDATISALEGYGADPASRLG